MAKFAASKLEGFNYYQKKLFWFPPQYTELRPTQEDWDLLPQVLSKLEYWQALECLLIGKISVRKGGAGNRPCGIKEDLIIPQMIRLAAYSQLKCDRFEPESVKAENRQKIETPIRVESPVLRKV